MEHALLELGSLSFITSDFLRLVPKVKRKRVATVLEVSAHEYASYDNVVHMITNRKQFFQKTGTDSIINYHLVVNVHTGLQ